MVGHTETHTRIRARFDPFDASFNGEKLMTGDARMQQERIHDDDLIFRVVANDGSLHRSIRRTATDPPLTGSFFAHDPNDKTPSPSLTRAVRSENAPRRVVTRPILLHRDRETLVTGSRNDRSQRAEPFKRRILDG